MKKFLLAAMLVCAPFAAFGQTPHEDCDHMANNSSATVTGNSSNDCLDELVNGQGAFDFAADTNDSMTADNLRGVVATVPAGSAIFLVTSSVSLTATRDLDMPNDIERVVRFRNGTTGDQSIRIIQNAGRTVTIPPGLTVEVALDGTNVDATGVDPSTELTAPVAGDRYVTYDVSADAWTWVDNANLPGSPSVGSGQTTDGTALPLIEQLLASGESIGIRAQAHGLLSTGESHYQELSNSCRNDAGTTTCGTTVDHVDIDLGTVTGTVDCDIVADDTADSADLECTGATSETWDWVVEWDHILQ